MILFSFCFIKIRQTENDLPYWHFCVIIILHFLWRIHKLHSPLEIERCFPECANYCSHPGKFLFLFLLYYHLLCITYYSRCSFDHVVIYPWSTESYRVYHKVYNAILCCLFASSFVFENTQRIDRPYLSIVSVTYPPLHGYVETT